MGTFTMSDNNERERDRQSLRDLAKLSQQTGPLSSSVPASVRVMPPPSSGVVDNSGLIDLERLSEAIRATTEAQSETTLPPVVPSVESVAVASSSSTASRTFDANNPDLTPLSPSVTFAEKSPTPAPTPEPPVAAAPSSKLPAVVGGLVLVAAAAFLATRKEAPTTAASPAASEAQVAAPSLTNAAPTQAPTAAPTEAKAEAPKAVSKPVDQAKLSVEAPKVDDKATAPGPTEAVAAAKAVAAPVPVVAKGPKVEKSFADEMAAAVTGKLQVNAQPTESAAAGPAGPAAGMAKPSQGQIQAAFQKVKGSAHNCLGGQEIEVKTMVTFGSDGKVQKVAVSNAPDPGVGSCIEGAVNKATVPAFTDATFTAPLTVR